MVLGIDHIGSAHDEGQLAMLLQTARARLNAGQQMLPIEHGPTGTADRGAAGGGHGVADRVGRRWRRSTPPSLRPDCRQRIQSTVLARIIEPTSKADTVRVLSVLRGGRSVPATFMHGSSG